MERMLRLCIFILCSTLACQAEVLDRIVAVVNGRIITLSDVRQEREVRARLGQKSVERDAALVKALIDERLIESEIMDYPGIDVTDDEVNAYLQSSVAREGAPSRAIRDA